jgi:DNA modification methylase
MSLNIGSEWRRGNVYDIHTPRTASQWPKKPILINSGKLIKTRIRINDLGEIGKNNNSIHSLSPYVGKIRSDLIQYLIDKYAVKKEYIYDPFCGSGTVLLEGWVKGYDVIGVDLNPYAYTLSMGKVHPLISLNVAEEKLVTYNYAVMQIAKNLSIANIPDWVKDFFNKKTLKEIYAWIMVLQQNKEHFLLSCLLGILHHQRPGFLSFPSSHGAPYLRSNKYPQSQFPEMYEYRNVYDRLLKKVHRSYHNSPDLDFAFSRDVYLGDSSEIILSKKRIATIITSPPYMKSLTYARDNRLRLWFLGIEDWKKLDKIISPTPEYFIDMMENCFKKWSDFQLKSDKCIIIIGDIPITYSSKKIPLHEAICEIAKPYYQLIEAFKDPIPEAKKMVKGNNKIKQEIILVLERN